MSAYAPRARSRATPGLSVDSIGPSDGMVLQMAINAVAFLRQAGAAPHEDGTTTGTRSPLANAQFFSDAVFQRLNQSLPEHAIYKEGFIGTGPGIMFFHEQIEAPGPDDRGGHWLTLTASGGFYLGQSAPRRINGAGTAIGRIIITWAAGRPPRALARRCRSSSLEAGITGTRRASLDVINNNIKILTSRRIQSYPARADRRAPAGRDVELVHLDADFPVPHGSARDEREAAVTSARSCSSSRPENRSYRSAAGLAGVLRGAVASLRGRDDTMAPRNTIPHAPKAHDPTEGCRARCRSRVNARPASPRRWRQRRCSAGTRTRARRCTLAAVARQERSGAACRKSNPGRYRVTAIRN